MEPNNAHQPEQGGYTPQPVAYDKDGNPLYSRPQFVHLSRAVEPVEQPISPEVVKLHDDARRKYPRLNLSKGEYIISAVKRHPIGLLKIWSVGLALIVAFMAMYYVMFAAPTASSDLQELSGIAMAVLAFMLMLAAGGTMAATHVYNSNRFYLTNESVIQEIQTSLFSRHEQTVSLSNIEDASYKQGGVLPVLFNYGMIRLSTEGDETTYRFSYVSNPKKQIAILNNAVEAFKNGRPVGLPNDD
ncbi:MAG TPA: hypothetical protein VIS56_01225 [Candidatus Saccharimonadales bacterium]